MKRKQKDEEQKTNDDDDTLYNVISKLSESDKKMILTEEYLRGLKHQKRADYHFKIYNMFNKDNHKIHHNSNEPIKKPDEISDISSEEEEDVFDDLTKVNKSSSSSSSSKFKTTDEKEKRKKTKSKEKMVNNNNDNNDDDDEIKLTTVSKKTTNKKNNEKTTSISRNNKNESEKKKKTTAVASSTAIVTTTAKPFTKTVDVDMSDSDNNDDFVKSSNSNTNSTLNKNTKTNTNNNLEMTKQQQKQQQPSTIRNVTETYYQKACKIIWELTDEERIQLVNQTHDIIANYQKYERLKHLKNVKGNTTTGSYFYRLYYSRAWLIRFITKSRTVIEGDSKTEKIHFESPEHCTHLKMCKFCNGLTIADCCTTLFCPGPDDLPYSIHLEDKKDEEKENVVNSTNNNNNSTTNTTTVTTNTTSTTTQTKDAKSAFMTKFVMIDEKNNVTLNNFLSTSKSSLTSFSPYGSSSSEEEAEKINFFSISNSCQPILYKIKCSTALRKSGVSKGCQGEQHLYFDWFIFLRMKTNHKNLSDNNIKCPIEQHYNKTLYPKWFKENTPLSIIEKTIKS